MEKLTKKMEFNFWTFSAKLKTQLKEDIDILQSKIKPLEAWIIKTKQDHQAKGTNPNRDAAYVQNAHLLVQYKSILAVKKQLFTDVVKVRMEQHDIRQYNSKIEHSQHFAELDLSYA